MQLIFISYCSVLILCSLSKGQENEDESGNASPSRGSPWISPRVIGGVDAKSAEFPFAVSIQKKNKTSGTFFHNCGGVIITNRLILTVAHCIHKGFEVPGNTQIVVGTINLEFLLRNNADIFQVETYYIHPQHDDRNLDNDIALVVIKPPLTYNRHTKAVHLPTTGREPTGKCTGIGWGLNSLSPGGPPPKLILQKVELDIWERDECIKFHKYSNNYNGTKYIFTRRMFCSYGIDKGMYKGDSGSPIMCKDKDQHVYLAGLDSYSRHKFCKPCRISNVFSHVGQFYCYIRRFLIQQTRTKSNQTSASVETNIKTPSKKICRSSNRNKTHSLSPTQYGNAVRQCMENGDPCNNPSQCCTGYCRSVPGRGLICTKLEKDDPRGDPTNDAFDMYGFLIQHFLDYKGWFGGIWWEFNSDRWLTVDDAREVLRKEIVNTYRFMQDTDTCCIEDMYKLERQFQKCLRVEHKMILLVGHTIASPRTSYVFQTTKGMVILITNGTRVDILKGWNIVSYWKETLIKNNR